MRAQKRIQDQGKTCLDNQGESLSKRTRSTSSNDQSKCFFCGESAGKEGLDEGSTFQLDKNARRAATVMGDMQLLGRVSAGDIVALEAKYHTNCLLKLYNRATIMQTMKQTRMRLY